MRRKGFGYNTGAVRKVLRTRGHEWEALMDEYEHVRIRLMGGLAVHRLDGSRVEPDEWRTGKNMDLLRLLALENGRPVRVPALLDRLWRDAPPERARGSLRTACSQIRRAVGTNCIVRHPDGLVLRGAWVDAVAFLDRARRVSLAARADHHARVVALARSAERLYAGPFRAYHDDSFWAVRTREHLASVRHEMLCDAAASALELRRPREAAGLALAAVELDPLSERGPRLLMAAHGELGEVASALRVFEGYRAHLADELGADPSPQTRELHLRLLRGLGA